MWELPIIQVNVCWEVYVVPSTTMEPDGLAITIMDTVAGDKVVLVVLVDVVVVVVLVAVVVVLV